MTTTAVDSNILIDIADADRLLTRDLGFTRMNVPGLVVVSPDSLLA
jgi:hypothetical protein